MKLEKLVKNINSKLLKESDLQYDLSSLEGIFDTEKSINGISDVLKYPNLVTDKKIEAFIDDKTRDSLISLLNDLKANPAALDKVKKILVREILYLGAECQELGYIDVENEFEKLERLITNEYLIVKRVSPPTISNFISVWHEIQPKIIFISCHGDKLGLFLNDENSDCKHYSNLDFYNFFKLRSEFTECVVLSSCESLDLGKLITEDGKNVVCINKVVDIKTAAKYSELFFDYMNKHSLENNEIYLNAHNYSMEVIQYEGLRDSFSFEFIKAKKIH